MLAFRNLWMGVEGRVVGYSKSTIRNQVYVNVVGGRHRYEQWGWRSREIKPQTSSDLAYIVPRYPRSYNTNQENCETRKGIENPSCLAMRWIGQIAQTSMLVDDLLDCLRLPSLAPMHRLCWHLFLSYQNRFWSGKKKRIRTEEREESMASVVGEREVDLTKLSLEQLSQLKTQLQEVSCRHVCRCLWMVAGWLSSYKEKAAMVMFFVMMMMMME